MSFWKRSLDTSMLRLKAAGDDQVEALVPDPAYLEELRDARWDALPHVEAKVENLNRRMRRLEAKAGDGIEQRAKKWAQRIAAAAVIAGAAVAPVEKFIAYWKLHSPPAAEELHGTDVPSLTIDRVARPNLGAPK